MSKVVDDDDGYHRFESEIDQADAAYIESLIAEQAGEHVENQYDGGSADQEQTESADEEVPVDMLDVDLDGNLKDIVTRAKDGDFVAG